MEKNNLLAGVAVALGLLLLGIALRNGINSFKEKERVVSVKGLSEKEVPADKVIWPLMYKEIGNDISQLYVSLENKNKAIKDFLMKNGISEDEITVSAPEIIDMKAERYVNENITYR